MSFRLLGIPVRVGPSFLLLQVGLAVFISLTLPTTPFLKTVAFLIISAVVFVSVLVHELGHALAARRAGLRPEVTLTWFGGFTRFVANVGPGQRLWISAAGVVFQAALAGVVWILIRQGAFGDSEIVVTIAEAFVLFNLVMAGINLIPVGGMDGGAILGSVLELLRVPRPRLVLLVIYGIGGVAITLWALATANWILVLAGMYLTFVGLRSQTPYVRFEQDAIANPDLEATVRRLLMRRRHLEAADVVRGALAETDSPPYRVFATSVLLDALRMAEATDELREALDTVDLGGIDLLPVGRAHLVAGNTTRAIEVLAALLAQRDDALAAHELAKANLAAGNPATAAAVVARRPDLFQPLTGLDIHLRLVESGAEREARIVREVISAQRGVQLGATAQMLIAEGDVDEAIAMLRRDDELSSTRTSRAWLAFGLHLAGRSSSSETAVRMDGRPGAIDPEAANVLTYLLARRGDHEDAVAVGLPVVRAGRPPSNVLPYNVASSLDAIGRTDEALDLLETIDAEYVLQALAEHDDFSSARDTDRFDALVEQIATSRM